ncbi:MAG: hypothetical protein IPP79_16025 [Chitinophagaceae bacterium]|nr:hypothetical protein [Chitinophagaceae bacterium]
MENGLIVVNGRHFKSLNLIEAYLESKVKIGERIDAQILTFDFLILTLLIFTKEEVV